MKKSFFKTLVALMAFGVIISACSKDDSKDDAGAGSISYKGQTLPMTQGTIEYTPSVTRTNLFELDCTLASAGINLDEGSGAGNFINFTFISTSSVEITPGTYIIGGSSGVTANVISRAMLDIGVNLSLTNFNLGTIISIPSGTVVVAKTGSTYTLTINCKNGGNDEIIGTYVGSLKYSVAEEEEKK